MNFYVIALIMKHQVVFKNIRNIFLILIIYLIK